MIMSLLEYTNAICFLFPIFMFFYILTSNMILGCVDVPIDVSLILTDYILCTTTLIVRSLGLDIPLKFIEILLPIVLFVQISIVRPNRHIYMPSCT